MTHKILLPAPDWFSPLRKKMIYPDEKPHCLCESCSILLLYLLYVLFITFHLITVIISLCISFLDQYIYHTQCLYKKSMALFSLAVCCHGNPQVANRRVTLPSLLLSQCQCYSVRRTTARFQSNHLFYLYPAVDKISLSSILLDGFALHVFWMTVTLQRYICAERWMAIQVPLLGNIMLFPSFRTGHQSWISQSSFF